MFFFQQRRNHLVTKPILFSICSMSCVEKRWIIAFFVFFRRLICHIVNMIQFNMHHLIGLCGEKMNKTKVKLSVILYSRNPTVFIPRSYLYNLFKIRGSDFLLDWRIFPWFKIGRMPTLDEETKELPVSKEVLQIRNDLSRICIITELW